MTSRSTLAAPEANDRRDDSPSSIDTLKRAIGVSPSSNRRVPLRSRLQLKEDYRARLPLWLSRFIGYRPPDQKLPYEPVTALRWVRRIPLKYEVWVHGWIGSFVGILLVEAIMSTRTVFRESYNVPLSTASFGATAVLIYGALDSPLAQPRNLIGGHVISAIIGVAITRLFARNDSYIDYLDNREFHFQTFLNGALCMATSILAMFVTGTLHPPGGATALIAAIEPAATRLSWRYIPVIIASTLIMFGWAMLINNLGRRKYPQYWWAPQRTFVVDPAAPGPRQDEEMALATSRENPMRRAEDGGRTNEALKQERIQGRGGDEGDMADAVRRARRSERAEPPDR